VRGGDLSWGIPLVGNWSEMLLISQRLDVLPVWVLTGVLRPPHLEYWLRHCQSWPSHCQSVLGYLVFKGDIFAVKGGPNPGPHQWLVGIFEEVNQVVLENAPQNCQMIDHKI
jgi:hypothetical protein